MHGSAFGLQVLKYLVHGVLQLCFIKLNFYF
jgi:hypothetical protein